MMVKVRNLRRQAIKLQYNAADGKLKELYIAPQSWSAPVKRSALLPQAENLSERGLINIKELQPVTEPVKSLIRDNGSKSNKGNKKS